MQSITAALGIPTETSLTAEELAEKTRCEASLAEFIRVFWDVIEPDTPFVDNWHIDAIALHLEALINGSGKPNLLMNIPPGCMKSLSTCVFLPAWIWGPFNWAACRMMFASYDQGLATRDSTRTRDLINSEKYQRYWGDRFKLRQDQNEKRRFDNDQRGWRIATSIGGRGTGEHPHLIVADDPTNVKKASSEKERTAANDWWDGTISTRGQIKSLSVKRAVIMQRLHEEDLSGHVKALGGEEFYDEWDWLCLGMRHDPTLMERPTSIGWTDPREDEGDLLSPRAFDEQIVRTMEKNLGTLRAAGQLGQRPYAKGGDWFQPDWFEIVDVLPPGGIWLRYWDKAGTEGGGAYTVGALMYLCDGIFYVAHIFRQQLGPARRNRAIKTTAERDNPKDENGSPLRDYTVPQWFEKEPASGGVESALISTQQLTGICPVFIDRVSASKEVRAMNWQGHAEAGLVKLLRGAWNQAFLDEAEAFPNGPYKDQIDAVGGGFAKLALNPEHSVSGDLVASSPEDDLAGDITADEMKELPANLRGVLEGLLDDDDDDDWDD